MGRFVNPKSVRYGELLDWSKVAETGEGYLKVKAFLDYVERLLNKNFYKDEGIVLNNISLENYILKIELYDRLLELSMREGTTFDESFIEKSLGKKLLIVKRLLLSEGYKYFGRTIEVEIDFIEFKGLTGKGIGRFIGYNLLIGYSLVEILRVVAGELRENTKSERKGGLYDLTHREERVYADAHKLFKGIQVTGSVLLGYRVDVAGRYSRKQRASKKSVCEGTVPLNSYKGYIDYGKEEVVLDYGSCSVRVWLYYEKPLGKKTYLCRIR